MSLTPLRKLWIAHAHQLARPLRPARRGRIGRRRRRRLGRAGRRGRRARRPGTHVTLFEMAPHAGRPRARRRRRRRCALDNGQHILHRRLRARRCALMRDGRRRPSAGLPAHAAALRRRRRPRPAPAAAARRSLAFVARRRGRARLDWSARRLRCCWPRARLALRGLPLRRRRSTVAELCAALCRQRVRRELIEPLCVAALNTPAAEASGQVFLRVLRDALFGGPGSADLLLPRVGLGDAAADAARRAGWRAAGATIRLGHRVRRDRARRHAAGGRRRALRSRSCSPATRGRGRAAGRRDRPAGRRPPTRLALRADRHRLRCAAPARACRRRCWRCAATPTPPAQFVFDRGQLGGPAGLLAFVISGASVDRARDRSAHSRRRAAQADAALGALLPRPLSGADGGREARHLRAARPALVPAADARSPRACWPAGDYVDGPYPATLEGAVRSGVAAARAAHRVAWASIRHAESGMTTRAKRADHDPGAGTDVRACSTCWPRIRTRFR